MQHPDRLGNDEHGASPYSFTLSRQELLCLLESFSASIWDTLIANLDLHLERKEETDQTLSPMSTFERLCFLIKWTISEIAGLDSSWVQSPQIPAGAGWSEVMLFLMFNEQRIIFVYPKGSEEPSVWVTGVHGAAANSPRPQWLIRSGSRRVCSGALRTWMFIPNCTFCRRGWMQEGRELMSL